MAATGPPMAMLLRMRQANQFAQAQRIATDAHAAKASLDYLEEGTATTTDVSDVDAARRRGCLKAIQPIFHTVPGFSIAHAPHRDLLVTYAMALATHAGFADYDELKTKLGSLNQIRRRTVWTARKAPIEVCPACQGTDLVVVEHEARQVCRSCGVHIGAVRSTAPERLNRDDQPDRTHHGDPLSPFLTAHGQTQGGPLDGEFADAQRRVDERHGQNHHMVGLSTMDAHINRAADHLKNDLPALVRPLFESNQAMFDAALHLFAAKRKTSRSLHEADKWLAAAAVLAIILHLEVRKASSVGRHRALRGLLEASHTRLLAPEAPPAEPRLATLDEEGVRRFLFHAVPKDDVERVVRRLRAVQERSAKLRPLGALLSSTAPAKMGWLAGDSAGVILRMTKRRRRDEAERTEGRKRQRSSKDNIRMVLERAPRRSSR